VNGSYRSPCVSRHKRAGLGDLRSDRISVLREKNWLKGHGLTWGDLPQIFGRLNNLNPPSPPPDPRDAAANSIHPVDDPQFTPAGAIHHDILERYVALTEHEYTAVALWIIYTHVYDKFMVSPRLLLKSPVRGCGKSTLLDVMNKLVARPKKSVNITAATIYYIVNEAKRTLLLDEADNLEASAKSVLRAVLNANRRGDTIDRVLRGRPHPFEVLAPIALASIGSLPLPLMRRSIVINMQRHDGARTLRRFDVADVEGMQDFDIIYSYTRHWIGKTKLNPDPAMPAEVRGFCADNWRPLISIADACSPEWGARAREAAIAFAKHDRDEDVAVSLLHHIRVVFAACGLDRLASKALIIALHELAEADGLWSEWRGPQGNERPRKLTQNALATLLREFHIRPRTIWPPRRSVGAKGPRGYLKADFETAWRNYCDEGAAPPRPHLRLIGE
jgi:hypothetical protein